MNAVGDARSDRLNHCAVLLAKSGKGTKNKSAFGTKKPSAGASILMTF